MFYLLLGSSIRPYLKPDLGSGAWGSGFKGSCFRIIAFGHESPNPVWAPQVIRTRGFELGDPSPSFRKNPCHVAQALYEL